MQNAPSFRRYRVSGIPKHVTECDLFKAFSPCGRLFDYWIDRDPLSGSHRSCAYLIFRGDPDFELQRFKFEHQHLSQRISLLADDCRVLVGGFPHEYAEQEMVDAFKRALELGINDDIVIEPIYGPAPHFDLSPFAFLYFDDRQTALDAHLRLPNLPIFESDPSFRVSASWGRLPPPFKQSRVMFVSNIFPAVKEQMLYDLFAQFGEIQFAYIVDPFKYTDRSKSQIGFFFGFVGFMEKEDMNLAIKCLNQTIFCGKRLGLSVDRGMIHHFLDGMSDSIHGLINQHLYQDVQTHIIHLLSRLGTSADDPTLTADALLLLWQFYREDH